MHRSNRKLLVRALNLAGVLFLAGSAWAAAQNAAPSDSAGAASRTCQVNLKALSTAMLMYVQDYDMVLPPAGRWTTGLRPYYKADSVLHCPVDTGHSVSYAMNRNLSARPVKTVKEPWNTVLFFESDLHQPSRSGLAAAVVAHPRHPGGSNYAYLDGHVKLHAKAPSFDKPYVAPKRPAVKRRPRR